jgi:outer membrane protein
VSGAVKEAYSIYRQAMLELQRMERYVDYSIRKTHGELEAAIKETVSREEATRAAQQSYDSLRKEYRLGLVTNLDVLQAMDFLQTQKTQLDAARIQTKLLFIQLNVEMDRML